MIWTTMKRDKVRVCRADLRRAGVRAGAKCCPQLGRVWALAMVTCLVGADVVVGWANDGPPAGSNHAYSGMRGRAVIGCGGAPIPPGQQPPPCRRDPASYAALRFVRIGCSDVNRVRADARGRFRIALRPGRYRVYGAPVRNRYGVRTRSIGPLRVHVASGHFTRLRLVYDSRAI